MKKAIWIVVALAVIFGLKFYNRGNDEKDVLAEMKAVIVEMGLPADDTTYLHGVVERVHPDAFDAAYSMGSRRRAATLDEQKYIQEVFKGMIRACTGDNKHHLIEPLLNTRDLILEGLNA